MNIVDIGILAVIGASLLFGLYRGFISSVGSTGGCLISFIVSFHLYPVLAGFIRSGTWIPDLLATYIDKIIPVGNEAAGTEQAVARLGLPQSFADAVRSALSGIRAGDTAAMQSAVSETLVGACISILSFVVCFILLYVVFSLVMSAVRTVFRLPVLKQLDTVAGGIFGLLREVVFVFVIFTLLPVAQSLVPGGTVTDLVSGSSLAGIFDSKVLIGAVLRGSLF